MAVEADSDGVVSGVLLCAVALGEGVALGATLRSTSDCGADSAVVVGAAGGPVVVVEVPGAADSGTGAVVLVVVLGGDVGVVVG